VNNRLFTKKNGEKEEKATYIDCETWDKRADYAAERVKKGAYLLIQGRLEGDEWNDKKTGEKRSRLKVYVENLQVDTKPGEGKSKAAAPEEDGEQASVPAGDTSELPF
jgi:single-strand DNA-binding protein